MNRAICMVCIYITHIMYILHLNELRNQQSLGCNSTAHIKYIESKSREKRTWSGGTNTKEKVGLFYFCQEDQALGSWESMEDSIISTLSANIFREKRVWLRRADILLKTRWLSRWKVGHAPAYHTDRRGQLGRRGIVSREAFNQNK